MCKLKSKKKKNKMLKEKKYEHVNKHFRNILKEIESLHKPMGGKRWAQ